MAAIFYLFQIRKPARFRVAGFFYFGGRCPRLNLGDIEVKPGHTFAYSLRTDNFNGNLDPHQTCAGTANMHTGIYLPGYEGRPDLGQGNYPVAGSVKPVEITESGILVRDMVKEPVFRTVEYRQLGLDTLVGVRKMNEEGKPCLESKEVTRREMREVEVDRQFLGIGYRATERREVEVHDHWENARDYGVPGVCEVYYLLKSRK